MGLPWNRITAATLAEKYSTNMLTEMAGNAFSGFCVIAGFLAFLGSVNLGVLEPFTAPVDASGPAEAEPARIQRFSKGK